jgi:hypothetical protein
VHQVKRVALFTAASLATAGTITAINIAATLANGDSSQIQVGTATANEAPNSAVETYEYPEAADILKDQKVELISGDGHILIADCSTPRVDGWGLIEVHTSAPGTSLFCFKVVGNSGYLSMKIPAVFEIHGDGYRTGAGHNITAIVSTEDGELPPVKIKPANSTAIGIADPTVNKEAMLLELRVTP